MPDVRGHPTQEQLNNLEKKEFVIEVKEFSDEQGTFVAPVSPFNIVDFGADMTVSSIVARNQNKIVPFLLGHARDTEQGELTLFGSESAMMGTFKLYLDKLENGNPVFPEAYRTYKLAKSGRLKLSIGYIVHAFEYRMINGIKVRVLTDIEIVEVSRVTFPMNNQAVVNAVNVKDSGGAKVEEKATSLMGMINGQNAMREVSSMHDALWSWTRQIVQDGETTAEAKKAMIDAEMAAFCGTYAAKLKMAIDAGVKSSDADIETKTAKDTMEVEVKAGAAISKSNLDKIKAAHEMIVKGCGELESLFGTPEAEDEEEKASGQEIETKMMQEFIDSLKKGGTN